MIRERIKWADPFTQSILMIVLMFIMELMFIFIQKKFALGASFIMLGPLRLIYMIKNESGLIIENEYPGEFYVKPENSDVPIKITQNSSLPIEVDGIKINNTVFRVQRGTNVKIRKDGKIITYSPISRLVNEYVKEKNFSKREFKKWKLLFDAN